MQYTRSLLPKYNLGMCMTVQMHVSGRVIYGIPQTAEQVQKKSLTSFAASLILLCSAMLPQQK